jgi:hypothetical protein
VDETKEANKGFGQILAGNWKQFGMILMEPWTLMLLISVLVLFFISTKDLAKEANAAVQLLLTLSSGVLGGRIANKLGGLAEGNVLHARGKSAVRSLKLLLAHTASLETRVRSFVGRRDEIESIAVTVRNYEEIVGACRMLQEQAVSSIENWTDIVSEADVSTAIGQISELQGAIQEREQRIAAMKLQGEEHIAKSEAEKKLIADHASKLSLEVSQLRTELIAANMRLVSSPNPSLGLSGSRNTGVLGLLGIPGAAIPTFKIGSTVPTGAVEDKE